MFEKRVKRHEARMTIKGPEVVRRQHCHGRQQAQAACAEPDPATGQHQSRAAQFDDAGKACPQPTRTQREMLLLGDRTAEGGSMGGGTGPILYNGLLIMNSGYGFAGKMPGNALLVFEVE